MSTEVAPAPLRPEQRMADRPGDASRAVRRTSVKAPTPMPNFDFGFCNALTSNTAQRIRRKRAWSACVSRVWDVIVGSTATTSKPSDSA